MRTDIFEKREQILTWISENRSKAFMCRELNCKQDTLNRYLQKMDILMIKFQKIIIQILYLNS